MKNKVKLAFAQLERELQVIQSESLKDYIGGSGGYDCFYQCMAYASQHFDSEHSGQWHDAAFYEQQYQQYCGNSYYDPNNPGTIYSAEYASGHSGLIPIASGGVSSSNEEGFADQFYNTSIITIIGSGNTQSGVDTFNDVLQSGTQMFLNINTGDGNGHVAVINNASLGSDGGLNYQCWDPTLNGGNGAMVTYQSNGIAYTSNGSGGTTWMSGVTPSSILILQN